MNDDQFDDLLRDAARTYRLPPAPPREAMWARIEAARAAQDAHASPAPALTPYRRWRLAAAAAAVLLAGVVMGRASRDPVPLGAGGASSVASTMAGMDSRQGTEDGRPSNTAADPSLADPADDVGTGERDYARLAARGQRLTDAARAARTRETGGRRMSDPSAPGGTEAGGMNALRLAVVEHLARTEVLLTGFRSRASTGAPSTTADAQQFAALSHDLLQTTRMLLATQASDDPALMRLLEDLELVLMQITQYTAEGRRGDLDAINQSLDRRNVLPKLRSTIPAGAPASAGT